MPDKVTIALAPGDGIGPEIMNACLRIFHEAGVSDHVEFEPVEMGQSVFAQGESRGMTDEAVECIERCGILYKGPMGTPIGGGGKSINVTLRKTFGAFANLRHFQSLPGVDTVFSRAGVPVDMYIVRENVEDTYGGVEHRVTNDVMECKRLISAPGCDQVHEFAFQTAKRLGITEVQCGHKANIMKLTDGLFLSRFRTVGEDYPDIEKGDVIIDALCMNLVLKPQTYRMIVLPNLQGDIVSDLAAGLVGGLGFAPSANIGDQISIFEAVHGTAPDIAGKGVGNPTSLLLSGIMMLRHVGLLKRAAVIENALLATLEHGVHTGDFGDPETDPVGTEAFADAIIDHLGMQPSEQEAKPVPTHDVLNFTPPVRPSVNELMQTFTQVQSHVVGCDVSIETTITPLELASKLERLAAGTPYKLTMISNRGTQVWPSGSPYTELVNSQRVRFEIEDKHLVGRIGQGPTVHLLGRIAEKFTIVGFLPLREYDGERGFSLAQGQ
ncbi:MAG: isocitrate dehydrogenase [NADP] [Phycisphaeraceae bacterium]|nr:MAG: isocitrate dehydrogenase [NADP] [Phycisphaeraceae bacterium]